MQIRRCTAADVETVYRLEQAYIECPWRKADIAAALNDDSYVYLLAGDGIGYAGMQVVFEDAEITNIAVEAAERGRGVGGALLDALLEEAAARGATRVLLEVNENNRAFHLYRRKGFEKIAERKQYYFGQTAAVMAKSL